MNLSSLHPWHGIRPDWNGRTVQSIIEIPQGSRVKYEIDKESGLIRMDRLLSSSFEYPINYGFIPQTLGEDGDPLDILVLTHSPLVPLCLVNSRVLGIMKMKDRGINDDKIIAVAAADVTKEHIQNIKDLPKHFFKELKNFFEEYTKLENKEVVIHDFFSHDIATLSINEHLTRNRETKL
ncbi:MAG: inorganic diphosphatase [Saprospiraceae bacterium]|nr:inorganic diphosphatase [Saprospiraceae bacterium]